METKLFVGNLPYDTTEGDLQSMFESAGRVSSIQLIKDRDTGRSKGFAFVEMETNEDAQKAIGLLNGKEFSGRALTVNVARPREEHGGGGGGNRRGGGGGGFGMGGRGGGGGRGGRGRE